MGDKLKMRRMMLRVRDDAGDDDMDDRSKIIGVVIVNGVAMVAITPKASRTTKHAEMVSMMMVMWMKS